MELEFTKMHGAGNDFVFVDCLKRNIPNLQSIAKKLCDRRFGIGADQLLTVHPSKVADFKMEIYNADGGQVEMCGNGIRCFAKYVYDHGITTKRALEVETLAGIIRYTMPYLDPGNMTDEDALHLAAFITSKPRPAYPFKDRDYLVDPLPIDAVYYPHREPAKGSN